MKTSAADTASQKTIERRQSTRTVDKDKKKGFDLLHRSNRRNRNKTKLIRKKNFAEANAIELASTRA